jgi:hypothetical protein
MEQDVRGAEFIDNAGIPGTAPEILEPTLDDSFVLLLLRHLRELVYSRHPRG